MASSDEVVLVANAVVDLLNSQEWSDVDFLAERAWRPITKREDLATLRVLVIPRAATEERLTRAKWVESVKPQIAVQKALDGATDADRLHEADEIMEVARRVAMVVRDNPELALPEEGEAALMELERNPLFVPEHMNEHCICTSIITATYRVAV